MEQKKRFYSDLSFWALAASNLTVLLWARRQNLPLATMLWVYWGQGVGIGIFNVIKILLIKNYYTVTEKKSGKTREVTTKDKTLFAVMFLLFYGLLHQAYARYLSDEFEFVAFGPVFWMAVVLLMSHLFSFFYNRKWRGKGKAIIGVVFIFPFARVIPMYFTVYFGVRLFAEYNSQGYWIIFIVLKTFADLLMHGIEQKMFVYDSVTRSKTSPPRK